MFRFLFLPDGPTMLPDGREAGNSTMLEEAQILKLLGQRGKRPGALVELTRTGIDAVVAKRAVEAFQLSARQTMAILGTSQRTLARRLQKKEPLGPVESDRLVRFLRVAAHAEKVLEGRDRAVDWLKSPNRALGGKVPMELLDTDAGTEQVEEVLLRIDYGVYS